MGDVTDPVPIPEPTPDPRATGTLAPWERVASCADEHLVPPALVAVDDAFDVDGRYESVWKVTRDDAGAEVIHGGTVIDTYASTWRPMAVVGGVAVWTGPWLACIDPDTGLPQPAPHDDGPGDGPMV